METHVQFDEYFSKPSPVPYQNPILQEHEPTLHSVSLEIPAGSLTAIVGGTGQGKSSLVAALLGEMPTMDSGALENHINGRMAYVPQSSWIFNATVRTVQNLV